MAKPASSTAAMPNADDVDMDTTDETAGGDESDTDDEGEQPKVLCTIMCNPDGSYTLIEGDEPEGDEGAEGSGENSEAGESNEGTTYDSPGALLKGVLDLVKKDQEEREGGSAEDQFQSGFAGGSAASPAKPSSLPQKY